MKVVTFTPNPAVDLTIQVERLVPGEVHRGANSYTRAGGKGVNVSTNIAGYGIPTDAGGFLGTHNAAVFERHFSEARIGDRFIRVPGETRTNIKIVDAAGTTDLNLKSFAVSGQDTEQLLATAESAFSGETGIAVLSGSLPSGCPPDFYRTLIGKLKKPNRCVFLDADGSALKNALAGDVLPDCIKPNVKELSEWAGKPLSTEVDIITTARELLAKGLRLVAVSMGGDGALFVNADQVCRVSGRAERVASTVGAGDAMMAGIVSAYAETPDGAVPSLEYTAKLATAFALVWLEHSASANPDGKRISGFREKVAAALTKVSAEKK